MRDTAIVVTVKAVKGQSVGNQGNSLTSSSGTLDLCPEEIEYAFIIPLITQHLSVRGSPKGFGC